MSIEAIKEALEAGPTEGPWILDGQHVSRSPGFHLYVECLQGSGGKIVGSPRANATFIAACNPVAIRSLIERLEIAEKAAAEMKWRPIETAPKDGTHILLTDGEEIAQGWWLHEDPYVREVRDAAGVYLGQRKYEGFDGWVEYGSGHLPDPTHWMPLPPSPTTPQEDAHESS